MKMYKRNKYWNKKVIINWIKFDSKKEAKYYQQLKLLERAWNIKDLELQPVFELQPKFSIFWKTERSIKYIADFMYYDNEKNKQIVVDVKSSFTAKNPVYRIKKKLLLYKYPNISFVEYN